MSKFLAILAGLLLLVVLVLFSTTYTLRFHEVAVKTRFGKTSDVSIVREPGLHVRLPFFAERVSKLDTRLQLVESPLETVATADDQQILVKAFLLWKVGAESNGPLEFYKTYGDSVENATPTLEGQFREAVKSEMGRFAFDDLVGTGSRLPDAEKEIIARLARLTAGTGVQPVSAGISQFLLPAKTTQAVLARMQATRLTLAQNERSKGQAEAGNIMSAANSTAEKIKAFVSARADEIRRQGHAKAAEYMKQMGQAEDFAIFLVQLEAMKKALAQYTTLVLPATQSPLHLMNLHSPISSAGIPQPTDDVARAAAPAAAPSPAHTTPPPAAPSRGS